MESLYGFRSPGPVVSGTQSGMTDCGRENLNINKVIETIAGSIGGMDLENLSFQLLDDDYTKRKTGSYNGDVQLSHLLHFWKNKRPQQFNLDTLIEAFRSIERHNIAYKLEQMNIEKPGYFLNSYHEGQRHSSSHPLPSIEILKKELYGVAADWHSFAEQLLEYEEVERIDVDMAMSGCTEKLNKVLELWTEKCPDASMETLIAALESKRVSNIALAEKISEKFAGQASKSVTSRQSAQTSEATYVDLQEQYAALQRNYTDMQEQRKKDMAELTRANHQIQTLQTIVSMYERQLSIKAQEVKQLDERYQQLSVRAISAEDRCRQLEQEVQRLKRPASHRNTDETEIPAAKCPAPLLPSSGVSQVLAKIGEYPSHTPVSSCPHMKGLHRFMVDLALHWHHLGAMLGLQDGVLNLIKANHPNDCWSAYRDVLQKYLQTTPGASWSKFAKAVYDMYADQQRPKEEADKIFLDILEVGAKPSR
ncbi:MAG: hypothetical protein OXC48_12520 [Endozoicomonadaceae bacterium]|nr:hypothetical protein [Endozoicomonadaceae bacterium]